MDPITGRLSTLIATALILLLLGGCSALSGTPAFDPHVECERHGGWWHPNLNVCEYPQQ